jgi:hypothetical protein
MVVVAIRVERPAARESPFAGYGLRRRDEHHVVGVMVMRRWNRSRRKAVEVYMVWVMVLLLRRPPIESARGLEMHRVVSHSVVAV